VLISAKVNLTEQKGRYGGEGIGVEKSVLLSFVGTLVSFQGRLSFRPSLLTAKQRK